MNIRLVRQDLYVEALLDLLIDISDFFYKYRKVLLSSTNYYNCFIRNSNYL